MGDQSEDVAPDLFFDDVFQTALPLDVSLEVARFYGTGTVGAEFAQMLAAFLEGSRYASLSDSSHGKDRSNG